MNKKNLRITAVIAVILIIISVIFFITKKGSSNEKLYDFEDFNYLKNSINLVGNQNDVDQEIFNKIENGNYTINEPLLMHDPYGVSPLTALVGFKTPNSVKVKVTIHAKNNGKDLVYETKEGTTHYIPIYGLYIDHENQITLELSDETSHKITIPVEKNEKSRIIYFPDVEVLKDELPEEDNDFYFISTPVGNTAAAFDRNGEIRWYLTDQIYKQMTKLSNGHFLLSSPEAVEVNALGLLEIDLLGKVYNTYELANPYFHNFTELPNGNILYSTEDEKIIELNLSKGTIEKTYDIYEMLSDIDKSHMNSIKEDFGSINSLHYDKKNDSILVGLFYSSTLISIDKNGKIDWILANPEYYSKKFSKYLLSPSSSDFVYPKGNHNAKLENDKLSLMNNGWDLKNTWSCSASEGLKSSAKEYKVDRVNKRITEEWSFGENYFSFTFGDIYQNNNEKTVMFGREFRSFEEDLATCKLSDEGDFFSEIVTLKDNKEVFKMTVSNTYNYVSKMPIFSEDYTFKKETPKSFSADQISDTFKESDYKDKYKESILFSIPLELSGNKLTISYFEENYKIVLLNEYGTGQVYDVVENVVNLKKGTGNNLILIEHDGNIYNTGYYINI